MRNRSQTLLTYSVFQFWGHEPTWGHHKNVTKIFLELIIILFTFINIMNIIQVLIAAITSEEKASEVTRNLL